MKNLIQAAAVILSAASVAQAQEAVQWKASDGGNGHWYQLRERASPVSWAAANAESVSLSGHLATLTSETENQWVFSSVAAGPVGWSCTSDCYGPWLGGYQDPQDPSFSEPAGGWKWVTGEPWDFAPWSCNLPNEADPQQDFLHFYAFSGCSPAPGPRWDDLQDGGVGRVSSFVIEWSADCNGDGIVDYGQCRDGTLPDLDGNNIPDCCEAGVPCGSQPGGGESLGFLRLGRLTDTIELSGSAAYGTESTHEFRIRFPAVIQPLDGRLWSEQNGMDTDKAVGFGTAYAPNYSVHFGQCCQAPLHVVAAGDLLDGQWHHVAMVRTSSEFRLYVDGVLRASQPSWGQAGSCAGKCPRSIGAFRYSYTGDSLTVPSILADVDWIAISSTARYAGESVVVPCESDVVADEGTRMLFKFNEVGQNTVVSEAGAIVGTFGAGFGGATEPSIVPHCQPLECAKADIVGDGFINGLDLGIMLGQWGPANPSGTCDINLDGVVDSLDLGVLLSFWGPCTN